MELSLLYLRVSFLGVSGLLVCPFNPKFAFVFFKIAAKIMISYQMKKDFAHSSCF